LVYNSISISAVYIGFYVKPTCISTNHIGCIMLQATFVLKHVGLLQ